MKYFGYDISLAKRTGRGVTINLEIFITRQDRHESHAHCAGWLKNKITIASHVKAECKYNRKLRYKKVMI